MKKWEGIKRFYSDEEDEDEVWSNNLYPADWRPLIPSYTEEAESGQRKQYYILLEDIPDIHLAEFKTWLNKKNKPIQQIERKIETDGEDIVADEVVQCVNRRLWNKWFRRKQRMN